MIIKTCPVCGKSFNVSPSESKRESHCSWECRYDPNIRFLKRVKKTDDCWIWQGRKGRGGYGVFDWKNTGIGAHRASYELFIGNIPDELEIMHVCDNKLCVNPEHLRPGTHLDNMKDMYTKGRRKAVSGERNGNSKLKQEQVISIRKEYAEGNTTFKKLGKKYEVDQALIHRIVKGYIWKTIDQLKE